PQLLPSVPFLSITPPPPPPTLFPYTTLFRSTAEQLGVEILYDAEVVDLEIDRGMFLSASMEQAGAVTTVRASALVAAAGGFEAKDRKSTRLNSSHRTISYAVLCLKKKKQQSR